MSVGNSNYERLSEQTISEALSHIPNHERGTWVQMAMAVKSELGDAGFDIWNEWSARADNYNARDAKDVWRSVNASGKVTIATLIQKAKENGYKIGKPERISEDDYAKRIAERNAMLEREAEELKQKRAAAAILAERIYNGASAEGVASHPYITRKGIRVTGEVRVGDYTRYDGARQIANCLIIPIRNASRKIVSVQAIFPAFDTFLERDRDYLAGGEKQGGYFTVGAISKSTETVLICEGYSTGCALHQATGYPVLIAFDAGNLPAVARMARERLPNARVVLCADNDQFKAKALGFNQGVKSASEAASLIGGIIAVPVFKDLEGEPTDFNDLEGMEGASEVRRQIEAALNPPTQSAPEPEAEDKPKPDAEESPDASDLRAMFADTLPTQIRFDLSAVDYYTSLPDTSGEGKKPQSTFQNLEEICRRANVTLRYNVISKEIEILIPNESFSMDNTSNGSLAWILSLCAKFRMPVGQIGDYLCYLADKNLYNPVANWIRSRPWDGVSRFDEFCDTIKTEGEAEGDANARALKVTLLRRWMTSALAAAFKPDGVSAHGVLVLQGEQYLGKTKWFKSLAPEELGVIRDGMNLKPDDRDSVFQVVKNWIVELGELDATFRKADIAALKAFLTRDKDVLRRAYARMESNFARRTIFFASVNPRQFLHDPTGNRRYWTLACAEINHSHDIDVQQVWAELFETEYLPWVYKKMPHPHPWYLTNDEVGLLNSHNSGFEVLDPIRERLQTMFDWEANSLEWRWMTATDIMTEIGMDKPTRSDVTHCGQVMRDLNGKRSKRNGGKNLIFMPPNLKRRRDGGDYRATPGF